MVGRPTIHDKYNCIKMTFRWAQCLLWSELGTTHVAPPTIGDAPLKHVRPPFSLEIDEPLIGVASLNRDITHVAPSTIGDAPLKHVRPPSPLEIDEPLLGVASQNHGIKYVVPLESRMPHFDHGCSTKTYVPNTTCTSPFPIEIDEPLLGVASQNLGIKHVAPPGKRTLSSIDTS